MDLAWCYLCLIESRGHDPRAAWGLDAVEARETLVEDWEALDDPMTEPQAEYLRHLCEDFGYGFDPTLTEGEADVLIESFLDEPMNEQQRHTLEWLADKTGTRVDPRSSYGQARATIRRLVALRALRSTA